MASRWGIVGIGWHAERFMALGIAHAKGAILHSVCSRDIGRAHAFAQRHGAAKTYSSYEAFLEDPQLDVVYVCSPNFLHREHVVKAAERRKHVLCEKVLALTLEDCAHMIEACDRAGVKLGTAFNARNHPAHRDARDYVASGSLGTIVAVQAMWASGARGLGEMEPRTGLRDWWNHSETAGGGALLGPGVHPMDLVRFILNDEVAAVTAQTDAQGPQSPLERSTAVLLHMRSGALAAVTSSRIIPDPRNDLHVYGVSGRLSCLGTLSTALKGSCEITDGSGVRATTYPAGDQFVLQVEAFNRAVTENGQPPATGWDGYKAQELCLAVFESARTGRSVQLPS